MEPRTRAINLQISYGALGIDGREARRDLADAKEAQGVYYLTGSFLRLRELHDGGVGPVAKRTNFGGRICQTV